MFRFRFGFLSGKKEDQSAGTMSSSASLPPKLDLQKLRQEGIARSERSLQALEHGQLPPNVIARLTDQGKGQLPWTSDLSVNEWLSLKRYKLHPLGQVMGSTYYQIGYVRTPNASGFGGYFSASRELQAPTQALYEGRKRAIARLLQEATMLGANAVVGFRMDEKGYEPKDGLIEFVCYGTAVRVEDLPKSETPIVCSVSGQDFVRLIAAGQLPVGLALGATVYYLQTDWYDMSQERSWYNQEMQGFTQGVYQARHLAVRKLREDMGKMKATGVVGADFTMRVEETSRGEATEEGEEIIDHILEVVMMGTAVLQVEPHSSERLSIESVFDLNS